MRNPPAHPADHFLWRFSEVPSNQGDLIQTYQATPGCVEYKCAILDFEKLRNSGGTVKQVLPCSLAGVVHDELPLKPISAGDWVNSICKNYHGGLKSVWCCSWDGRTHCWTRLTEVIDTVRASSVERDDPDILAMD